MRAAVAAQFEGVFEKYVDAAFHHMWGEPKKMDDPEVAMKAFTESGLDAAKLFARSQEPEVKAKLIENTQAAVERGAFGSPTFFVGEEMFFGKEQCARSEEWWRGAKFLMVRSALLRASRTMRSHATHPSRRGEDAAPQDEGSTGRFLCKNATLPPQ